MQWALLTLHLLNTGKMPVPHPRESLVNLALLINFTKQELVDRYSGSILGAAWTLILPLVNILIFIFVFSNLMGSRLPGSSSTYSYSIYLISGMIPWIAFSNTVTRSAFTFSGQSHIIRKIRISLPHLPLYIVLSESIIFVISLIFFLLFLWATNNLPSASIVILPFIFITQQILAYALGFLFAIFDVFIKDIREFVGVIFQLWFWLTPIVYVPDILPGHAQNWLSYNPAYIFIKAYHELFAFGHPLDTQSLMILVLIAHLLLALAYLTFKKLEKDIRDFL